MNSHTQHDGAVTVQWFIERREATSSRPSAQRHGATSSRLPAELGGASEVIPLVKRAASFLLRFSNWLDRSPIGLALGLIALGSLIFTVLSWGR